MMATPLSEEAAIGMASLSCFAIDTLSKRYRANKQSFIVALACPNVNHLDHAQIERATYGADVLELRIDHLSPGSLTSTISPPPVDYVLSQIEALRKMSTLPILFTIRTVSQGGKFPDQAIEEARELMLAAIRIGCEYIDIETTWPAALISDIIGQKEQTKVIASLHDWTGNFSWNLTSLNEPYRTALGFGDIVKLSLLHTKESDNHELMLFIRDHRERSWKPILAVGMGLEGKLSRVLAPISMVTHPLLPVSTAPGQMSVKNINQVRHLTGKIPPKKFVILGNNISHSLSPVIHNSAFTELGLPHNYSIYQTPQFDDSVKDLLKSRDFGGASVTYPHKLNIQPFLDSISENARIIGAVNTVVVGESEEDPTRRTLIGENTDWLGIQKCIQNSGIQPNYWNTAIVLGAGGAARAAVYALQELGCSRIIIVNRTMERAKQMVSSFPTIEFSVVQTLQDVSTPVNCIVACVPADDMTEANIPQSIFVSNQPGVLVEMAYRPKVTAIMQVARRLELWSVFSGLDVLKGQAYAQFELWTGYRAPVLAIADVLRVHESETRL